MTSSESSDTAFDAITGAGLPDQFGLDASVRAMIDLSEEKRIALANGSPTDEIDRAIYALGGYCAGPTCTVPECRADGEHE